MNSHIQAAAPSIIMLAQHSKHASLSVEHSSTLFEKRAHVHNLDHVNGELVTSVIKLGGAVLQAVKASKEEELLKKKKSKDSERGKEAMSPSKALAVGAGLAAVPTLAASYVLDKASDDMDSKMLAIPSLAASTVAAILAARSMSNPNPPSKEVAEELESAINAKQVVDNAIQNSADSDVAGELAKMSSISTDHIASLVCELLT